MEDGELPPPAGAGYDGMQLEEVVVDTTTTIPPSYPEAGTEAEVTYMQEGVFRIMLHAIEQQSNRAIGLLDIDNLNLSPGQSTGMKRMVGLYCQRRVADSVKTPVGDELLQLIWTEKFARHPQVQAIIAERVLYFKK